MKPIQESQETTATVASREPHWFSELVVAAARRGHSTAGLDAAAKAVAKSAPTFARPGIPSVEHVARLSRLFGREKG